MTKQKTAPEADFLHKASVRLICPEEQACFDALLASQHYLHSARVGGQSLRYAAQVDLQSVAAVCAADGLGPGQHTEAGRSRRQLLVLAGRQLVPSASASKPPQGPK